MIPDYFFSLIPIEAAITIELMAKFPALSPRLFQKDMTVFIIGESTVEGRQHFILKNTENIMVEFPVDLMEANGLNQLTDGRLELTTPLYNHWFSEKRRQQWEWWSEKLRAHFDLVWESRDLLISKPEYFLIRTPWIHSGSIYHTGSFGYPLGALLESWKISEDLKLPGKELYMAGINGSSLSGIHNYLAWEPKACRFKSGSLIHGDSTWKEFLQKFSTLHQMYPARLASDLLSIRQLLKELAVG